MWTKLVRAGYDHYRDGLNTPALLDMPLEVDGLAGLDAENFVRHAREAEETHPLGIQYELASALELPFEDASFNFVTAFMSLMDIPETGRGLAEVLRVLRPGGFLQFSISHPCFETKRVVRTRARWVTTSAG